MFTIIITTVLYFMDRGQITVPRFLSVSSVVWNCRSKPAQIKADWPISCWFYYYFKRSFGLWMNISINRSKICTSWPQLPVNWHQARLIWLIFKSDDSWCLFTWRSNDIRGWRGCRKCSCYRQNRLTKIKAY